MLRKETATFLPSAIDAYQEETAFVPPHPESVPELMGDLEKFWHNETFPVPHLIRIALSHYQFETIHPFLDGNGRIGRLLVPLYLVGCGILSRPSLYLSDFFERHRASYYDALTRARISNDLIHWVKFFLQGVAETARKGRDVFRKILQLRTETDASLLSLGKRAVMARQLVLHLYRRPMTTATDVEKLLSISTPTANLLLRELTRLGILKETTGRLRGRLYVFESYLQLFVA